MTRFTPLDREHLDLRGQAAFDAIAEHHGGQVLGAWAVMLRVPEVAEHVHALFRRLGRNPSFGPAVAEVVVLATAGCWSAPFNREAHERRAREAGVPDAAIEALRAGRKPVFTHDAEAIAYAVVEELNASKALSNATFDRARAAFGDDGLVELVSLVGFYMMVMTTIKAFDISG